MRSSTSCNSPPRLALHGGPPVRRRPLPLEFPGAHFYGREERLLTRRVLRARSPFRYYGFARPEMTERFEKEFAQFLGMPHALAVSSGTAALTAALMALGVGPGSEVVLPGYLWVSPVSAVVRLGAIPVLVDVDRSFCLDPEDLRRKLTSRTRAVIMIHMSGSTGRVAEVAALCRRRGIPLIEDVAQAVGASVRGRKLGSFGDLSTFSFQLNKNMTSGEGGAICARTLRLHRRAQAAHDLGYPRTRAGRLDLSNRALTSWGIGARMSEMTAALALAQLRKLPRICAAMRVRKRSLKALLKDIPGLEFRRIDDPTGDSGNFLITIFPTPAKAAFWVKALRAEGIVTARQGMSNIRMTDWGMHIYHHIPALVMRAAVSDGNNPWNDSRNRSSVGRTYGKGTLPECDDLISRSSLLCIPPTLTRRDLIEISAAFHKVAFAHPLVSGKRR
ncbi:MAG: aminotransferase class V-fold PLP-dependent enzyme [Verrucomicrobiae bacterium]|nr:aminotransferase class V-fold PLP-dependent enzyme [Verrucomicrobiae bacterium]